ncbi:L,D-transpeptidase [Brucella sp. IR073]|uniref:L,D-transpeptidase n=1 Tax=unclassified Brucella TaxID=2632610 RepID=UPI003B97F7A6
MKNLPVIMLAALLAGCVSAPQENQGGAQPNAYAGEPFPVRVVNRNKFDPRFRPATVANTTGEPAGTVVIDTRNNYLYLVEDDGTARRYGVAVGDSGHAWSGRAVIGRKAKWPAWHPTDDMHAQTPGLPRRVEPGPHNPLGARALYLYQDGKDTLYRIHGTSEPWTIGTKASSGCVRMFNEDIIDLYERVGTGASVVVR